LHLYEKLNRATRRILVSASLSRAAYFVGSRATLLGISSRPSKKENVNRDKWVSRHRKDSFNLNRKHAEQRLFSCWRCLFLDFSFGGRWDGIGAQQKMSETKASRAGCPPCGNRGATAEAEDLETSAHSLSERSPPGGSVSLARFRARQPALASVDPCRRRARAGPLSGLLLRRMAGDGTDRSRIRFSM
jgi:hypothetical protein